MVGSTTLTFKKPKFESKRRIVKNRSIALIESMISIAPARLSSKVFQLAVKLGQFLQDFSERRRFTEDQGSSRLERHLFMVLL
jgi:hypothetical protein